LGWQDSLATEAAGLFEDSTRPRVDSEHSSLHKASSYAASAGEDACNPEVAKTKIGYSAKKFRRAGGRIPLHPRLVVSSLPVSKLNISKGKKDKKQKSRGNPTNAEA
jgi:hypothetical protein